MKQLFFALFLFCAFLSQAKPSLTGDTSRPDTSVFPVGEKVTLTFHATKLVPNSKTELKLRITDEQDRLIQTIDRSGQTDSEGKWSVAVDAPNKKLGFYRVHAKLHDGTTIAKTVSREAGYITYAVVPGKDKYKLYPMDETFFGHMGPTWGSWEEEVGLRWGYGGKGWRDVEAKTPRSYIDDPNSGKIRVHPDDSKWKKYWINPNLHHRPAWMNDGKYFVIEENRLKKFTPDGEKLVSDFFEVYARNYEKDLTQPYGFLQYTWEPMFPWGFKGTIEDLVNIHKIIYAGIHKGSKRVKFIGPTAAGLNSLEWHEQLFKAGLLNYIDALSIHPYYSFPPEQNGIVEKIRTLRELIRKYAGRDIDIYGDEAGFPTHEKAGLELLQMYGILRSNLIFLGEGFKCNMVFYTHDYSGEPGYGIMYNLDPKRNWGPQKVAPKPLVPAIGAAAYYLNGHLSVGAIETLGETAWGYAYQRKDGFTTLALWDYSGIPFPVEIPTGKSEITLGDMMGNTRSVKTRDGMLALTLTEAPVYVIGVDPNLWGKNAVKSLIPSEIRISGAAGDEIVVAAKLNAAQKEMKGTLRIVPDKRMRIPEQDQNLSLEKGKKTEVRFKLSIPGNLPSGRYPVMLKFIANGKTESAAGLLLNIQPPIAIGKVLPSFQKGVFGLDVMLTGCASGKTSATLNVKIPGNPDGRSEQKVQLRKDETKNIFTPFRNLESNPLKNESVEILIRTSGNHRFKYTTSVNFARAACRPDIRPNSTFQDWKGIPMHPFDPSMIIDPGKIYTGKEDLDAKIGFAWNREWLLLKIEVTDDVFRQDNTGWATWDGDSIQLALSKAYKYNATSNMYEDKMNIALTELDFALTRKGAEVYRTIGCDEKLFPMGQISLSESPLAIRKTDLGKKGVKLEYEIAVPWKLLNLTKPPTAGERIGWAVTINDRDGEKNSSHANLAAFNLKKADLFGALILAE